MVGASCTSKAEHRSGLDLFIYTRVGREARAENEQSQMTQLHELLAPKVRE